MTAELQGLRKTSMKTLRQWLSACTSLISIRSNQGTLTLTQRADLTDDQHDNINQSYASLVDLQDDITRQYGIGHYSQTYVLKKTEGLGSCLPDFNILFQVKGATINLHISLFTNQQDSDLKEAIHGLLAHELAHAQHYHRLSTLELLMLGLRYGSYTLQLANSPWAEWVRSYERFTDLQAIAYGYGEALIEQKKLTRDLLGTVFSGDNPDYELSAYLTEEEIASIQQTPEVFEALLEKTLNTLEWDVFRKIAADFPSP